VVVPVPSLKKGEEANIVPVSYHYHENADPGLAEVVNKINESSN